MRFGQKRRPPLDVLDARPLAKALYTSRNSMSSPYNMAFACFQCCKSFKREIDYHSDKWLKELKCPECGGPSYNFGRHFKAPKKLDKKQWQKVRLLFDNGFQFQKIYDQENNGIQIPYPETLEQAKEFVERWSKYAIK